MYCNNCGKTIGEDAVFCQFCGVRVGPAPAAPAQKRLVRPKYDRKIAGVCAAVANYFGIDTTLVRVVWLCCLLLAGTGLLAYIIGWIVIPEEPEYVGLHHSA